jgi:hypothetical protein
VHKITWIVIKYFFFKRGARATDCVFTWFLATGIKQNATAVWTLPCIKLLGTIQKVWRQKKKNLATLANIFQIKPLHKGLAIQADLDFCFMPGALH